MFNFWDEEMDEESTERILDRAADEIRKRNLVAPALLALEMHKPLANVGGHAALVFSPFMVPFLGYDAVNDYSRVFAKRENIEKLLRKLEEAPSPDAAKGN
jgi:hypothetical protein